MSAIVEKVKELDTMLICSKNKKTLNNFGIFKNQEVKLEVKRINSISFYDDTIKQTRYISLTPKQMKCFKVV